MKCRYSIKNFRVFDSGGYTFEVNPITILTGCNSSGKSSLVKSIEVFSDWLERASKVIQLGTFDELFSIPLNFNLNYLKLGGLSAVMNNSEPGNHYIEFSIEQYSNSLATDIVVDYRFTSRKSDIADNAWLISLRVSERDGNELFSLQSDSSRCKVNLVPIKQHILKCIEYMNLSDDAYISTKDRFNKKYIKSQYGLSIYKNCSRIRDFRNLIDVKRKEFYPIQEGYPDIYLKLFDLTAYTEKVKLADLRHHLLHYPVIFNPDFKELDSVPKDKLFDFLCNKISKRRFDKLTCKQKESALLTLKWAIRIFQKMGVKTFSEFLLYCENYNGLRTRYVSNDSTFNHYSFSTRVFDALDVEREDLSLLKEIDESWNGKEYIAPSARGGCIIVNTPPPYSMIFKSLNIAYNGPYPSWKEYKSVYFDLISDILESTVMSSLCPDDFRNFMYLGTSQVQVNRLYSLGNTTDFFSRLLNSYVENSATNVTSYKPGTFINRWVKQLGIALKVSFKKTAGGSGVQIYFRDQNNNNTLLSDLGHGISQLLSVLLAVEITIMKGGATLAIEEPESHLHPNYQSILASIFVEAYKKHGVNFIVETHSEYMIRAFQKYIAYGPENNRYGITQDDLSIYYFNEPRKERRQSNEPQIKKIEIADDGCLINPFGPGFFDEALNLSTDLLRIKIERYGKQ